MEKGQEVAEVGQHPPQDEGSASHGGGGTGERGARETSSMGSPRTHLNDGRKRLRAAAERRGLYVWDEENEKREQWELPGKEFRKYYMKESDMEG